MEPVSFAGKTAVEMVTALLAPTAWNVGRTNIDRETGDAAMEDYPNVWEAILQVGEAFGIQIVPRMAYTYDGIERYIDLLDRLGENRGVD